MRLQQFINEKDEMDILDDIYEEFITKIYKDCKPFLKEIIPIYRRTKDLLYRGMEYYDKKDYGKQRVRKGRTPSATPLADHIIFDKAFNDKFGVRARSEGIFCSFDESLADQYGDVYVIFPIGKFTALWSNAIYDLTIDASATYGYQYSVAKRYSHDEEKMKEVINKNNDIIDKILNTYRKNDLSNDCM